MRGYLFAIDYFDEMNHQIFNVGSEELCLTKEQVALKIKEHIDFYLKFAEFGTDPDKRNYRVSFQKIKNLGFQTKYTIDDGIKEVLKALTFMEPKDIHYNYRIFK